MKTEVKLTLKVPADAAWDMLCDLGAVGDYLPAVSNCDVTSSGSEMIRTVYLVDGNYYEETISNIDFENRTIVYCMNEPSPFNYNNLSGRISVAELAPETCEVYWVCTYKVNNELCEETDSLLSLIMTSAIRRLEKNCMRFTTS